MISCLLFFLLLANQALKIMFSVNLNHQTLPFKPVTTLSLIKLSYLIVIKNIFLTNQPLNVGK